MDASRGHMLSELCQTEKAKYCMISVIGGIEKQKQWKTKSRLLDTENKWEQTVAIKGRWSEGEINTGYLRGIKL